MQEPIDFYFDFISPYAYLATTRIDQLAAAYGRKVRWRPVLLVTLFQAMGNQPAPLVPLKWRYVQHDLERSARAAGIPYRLPPGFPKLMVDPGRAMLWIEEHYGSDKAAAFARNCMRASFADGVDIDDKEVLAGIAAALSVEREALLAGMGESAVKARFKQASEQAMELGVCGVPFVIADGEPFWGNDRFDQLEAWLAAQRQAA